MCTFSALYLVGFYCLSTHDDDDDDDDVNITSTLIDDIRTTTIICDKFFVFRLFTKCYI